MNLNISPFQKRKLTVGDILHASIDLQFVVGRVEAIDGDVGTVRWETPLLQRIDNPPSVLIAQLDSKPRIMGDANMTKLE